MLSYKQQCLATALLALSALPSVAATYHVDVVNGNDAWSGMPATAVSNDGPWRTLSRATSARLRPGDILRLRCGQRWNETLRIDASGIENKPISVNAYPDGCTTAPAVDGAETVPPEQWQRHSGSIYKVQFPLSLIANGNLSQRSANWRFYSPQGDARAVYNDTCVSEPFGCMTFNTGATAADSLLITPTFAVNAGTAYQLTARVKLPAGQAYFLYLRKNSAPWSVPGLAAVKRVATGAWEDVAINFTAGASASNARIDIGVPGIRKTILVREVRLTTGSSELPVTQVFEGNEPITVAHHPNRGQDSNAADSVYLSTSERSAVFVDPATNRQTSNYMVTAIDEKLPPGAAPSVGNKLFLRTQNWSLSEFTVTGKSGNRISFSPNSPHPLSYPGWGYFYTGSLWMLDSPGEWFYDTSSKTIYVWSSNGDAPSADFRYSRLEQAASLASLAYLNIDGIAFRNAALGLDLRRSTSVNMTKAEVRNTAGYGVNGEGSINLAMSNMVFRNNLTDAVQAPNSTGVRLIDSDIEDSGVIVNANGQITSLPSISHGAIDTGKKSVIKDNRVRNTSYLGIAVSDDGVVSGNSLETFCLVLNDCGGLYNFGASRALFENNIVSDGRGSINGIPRGLNTHTVGVYFDRGTNAGVVRNNTVSGVDSGMQLHDARNNTIEGNKFYGNKIQQMWFQQASSEFNGLLGNVFGNTVRNNQFYPISTGTALLLGGRTADPSVFASFDGNRYSTLLTPLIANESSPRGSRSYSLPEWRLAVGANGARGLEANGRIASPVPGRALGRTGTNLVTNGALAVDIAGWTRGGNPAPTVSHGICPDGSDRCILLTASGGEGALSSPRFSLTAGAWYRVSFDAAVSNEASSINVVVRRSGPLLYDSLMGETLKFSGKNSLTRQAFIFKASGTAVISPTDSGARLDFSGVKSGEKLSVTNVEVVPVFDVMGGTSQSLLLTNAGRSVQQKFCPSSDSIVCASYVSFTDGTPISWPVSLASLQTLIVFAQDVRLPDADSDGITDSQDRCPGSNNSLSVNSIGCTREQ